MGARFMNKEIQQKNIIFYSVFLVITIVVFNFFFRTENYVNFDIIPKTLQKITISQNIAPQRLFINTWRIIKNSYVDETLNNQDWTRWRIRYIKHIKTIEDADIAINTMLASLNDPYNKFLQSTLFSKQKMIIDSEITGIGILFNKSGNEIVINHIMDNSPAQSANILPGDTIVSVNGEKTDKLEMKTIINTIENSHNKEIEITIKRNNILITKKVKRRSIPIKTMEYEITKDNIGIITLANIMGWKAVSDFKDIIIKTNNTKGIIIDLRNNYGGVLANAIQMANFMMDKGKIVSIQSRINTKYQIYSDGEKIFKNKPIVILINKNTASASEILAGTLKANLNAILIGESSYGKNSIQQVIPMQNETGLILTTDRYILPDGNDIYGKGLTPDIIIQQDTIFTKENDKQLNKAKKIIKEIVKNKK